MIGFLNQIALTPIDDDNTIYYVDDRHFKDNVLLLRYYNETMAFIGKKVVLKSYSQGELVDMKEIIKDGITGESVKLLDEKLEVIDVVLKDCRFYMVLKGENSGSFALETNSIYYSYSSNDLVALNDDQRGWSDIVKKYNNNMMDIPVIQHDRDNCCYGCQ